VVGLVAGVRTGPIRSGGGAGAREDIGVEEIMFVVVDEGDDISVVSTTGRVAQEKLQALSRWDQPLSMNALRG